jgi:hypothetical protein
MLDLADEVAPQQATWLLYRGDTRVGSVESRLGPRKDGLFDLTTRLRDLELDSGAVQVKVPLVWTTRTMTRTGDLVALESRATLHFRGGWIGVRQNASLKGEVHGDDFRAACEFDSSAGPVPRPVGPVRLISKNVFSPYQPLLKYPPLRPGQGWRASNVDPVGEILHVARPLAGWLAGDGQPNPLPDRRPPTEVAARVQEPAEELVTPRGRQRTCRVIVFEADGVVARTWVDVADGKVWRQEANGLGETIAFVRD